jgi:hypothetical protein
MKGTVMKSKCMILLAALILCTVTLKTDAEIAAGIILGIPSGISLRVDHFPVLAFGWDLDGQEMHVQGDYIFIDKVLQDPLRWYLGAGLFLGVHNDVSFGVRIPLGLLIRFHPNFEVFGELAPGIELIEATKPAIGGGIGIRYVF